MPKRRYQYTWDQINALNADQMARWGVFAPGCEAWVGFDDQEDLRIKYEMHRELNVFSVRYSGCRVRKMVLYTNVYEFVPIERRPCRFGGHRIFFRCHVCERATLMLAVLPEGLRCGRCGSVTWGSRREHAPQRLVRRANKVAAKLRCGEWSERPTERPLHMRMAIFEALKTERASLAEQIYERMDRQFMVSARVRSLLARNRT